MNYELDHLEYRIEGEGKPLLFLHGWGRNQDAFAPIISHLPQEYKIITLSLPGFGNSPEPEKAWTVAEYADLVERFLNEKLTPEERSELLCVTHSYGGRLAGKIRSFKRLVQIASAGVKPKRPLKYHIGLFFYKILKTLARIPVISPIFKRPHIAYRRLRSSDDYQNASPVMREALAYAINHDQKKDFAAITCPTLLIWGDADNVTPLWMGQTMETLIGNSALIVYPNATHQVLTECAPDIAVIIDKFFRSEPMEKTENAESENEKTDNFESEISETEILETEVSEAPAPEADISKAATPEVNISEATASETQTPEKESPELQISEVKIVEAEASEVKAGATETGTAEVKAQGSEDGDEDEEVISW